MTSAILILDTSVISEAMRPAPAPTVMSWLSRKPEDGHFFVTTVTMAEILYGVELLPRGKRHDNMLVQALATFAAELESPSKPYRQEPTQRNTSRRTVQGIKTVATDFQQRSAHTFRHLAGIEFPPNTSAILP